MIRVALVQIGVHSIYGNQRITRTSGPDDALINASSGGMVLGDQTRIHIRGESVHVTQIINIGSGSVSGNVITG